MNPRTRTGEWRSCCALFGLMLGSAAPIALADPLGAGDGTIYRMSDGATFQEGCFPPCLCPIMNEQPIAGTMKLAYHGDPATPLHTYSVEEVNWRVVYSDGSHRRIVGRGKYAVGPDSSTGTMQQRMELDLIVGDDPPEHFDSGWSPLADSTRIHVLVSIHGVFCWDRVIVIDADPVPRERVTPYSLQHGATYEHGCCRTSPCDCLCFGPVPMVGEFGLMPLSDNGLFREFAVLDVRGQVLSPNSNQGIAIRGRGFYIVGGEFAARQRLSLELWVDNNGPDHFDSGWVAGGGQFPAIDILMSQRGMDPAACVDTILHIIAKPVEGDVICGGIAGFPCPEGFFCKLGDGHCCCDFMGACAPIPEACPEYYDPVCACDGNTYGNECFASAAGVSIDHRGPCRPACGPDGSTCPDGYFCKFPIGVCDPASQEGFCAPRPETCPRIWDPVCGCDGVTYGNECSADSVGAQMAHRGICGQVCGPNGVVCGPDEFCKLPMGACDSSAQGVCTTIPQACPDVWMPVCGCDGVTYGNACEADAGAVSVKHPGECAPLACSASRVLSDPEPTFCPGALKLVRIVLNPSSTAQVLGVEDSPPRGWTVAPNISHGGGYDAVHGKVKWGPLFPPFPQELTYEVIATEAGSDAPPCFVGQFSVDGANEPICGEACLRLSCCPRLEADRPQPACGGCSFGDCQTCDGATCDDGRIVLCEVIGYACAWLRGCNDDLSGMTRAAYIWRSGECYCWDTASRNWAPAACGDAVCCAAGDLLGSSSATTARHGQATVGAPTASSANRRSVETVPINVKAPEATKVMALEIEIPSGWTVLRISDGGVWDELHRKVKWGPFFDNLSRTVEFEADGVRKGRGLRGGHRIRGISGAVSFDGVNEPLRIR